MERIDRWCVCSKGKTGAASECKDYYSSRCGPLEAWVLVVAFLPERALSRSSQRIPEFTFNIVFEILE